MPEWFISDQVQIVLKVSKYCNLRCSYCYEYKELGDKTLIPLSGVERILNNLASFRPESEAPPGEDTISFIWHGGEPLLVRMSYYDEVGALQRGTLGRDIRYSNSVQTNLTVLTPEHVGAFKEQRFFHQLGFSFDVYGNQRVDLKGRLSTEKVLKNLQTLVENRIDAAAIVVLSRSTLPHVEQIFGFYNALGIDYRLVPYNLEAFREQTEAHGLTGDEIAAGLCQTFDLWLASERPITIEPIETYLNSALLYLSGVRDVFFDKWSDESVFFVNTDGSVHGYESYGGEQPYGNLIHQTFDEILRAPARRRLADEASERVDAFCRSCRFHGACSGLPVAEAQPLERISLRERGCHVADVIAHMVARLEETGLAPHAAPAETRRASAVSRMRG